MTLAPTPFQVDDGSPFGNLPDVMIKELLERTTNIEDALRRRLSDLPQLQKDLRKRALTLRLIRQLPDPPPEVIDKTVVAVDGAYAIERLAGVNIYAAAAIRVGGYGGASSGQPPDFSVEIVTSEPVADGDRITSALMAMMECVLAATSERDLVLLDGSLFAKVLQASIAMQTVQGGDGPRRNDLAARIDEIWHEQARDSIPKLLQSRRVVAIPKQVSGNNIFEQRTQLFDSTNTDLAEPAIANLILKAGEFTAPLSAPPVGHYLGATPFIKEYTDRLNSLFDRQHIVYYKPHRWSHAYRIEMAGDVANDAARLHSTLGMIGHQCVNSAMREPYPLYLADRFVRSIGKGLGAVFDAARRSAIADTVAAELVAAYLSHSRSVPYRDREEDE